VGGPYEAFGDDGIAFIVDLEPSAIHEPRPGPLDDPALRKVQVPRIPSRLLMRRVGTRE
jgi:hypothetical protein